jgi:hypothetical protein
MATADTPGANAHSTSPPPSDRRYRERCLDAVNAPRSVARGCARPPAGTSSSHNGAVSDAAEDARPPTSSQVAVHAEDRGVTVAGLSTPDPDTTLIPRDQAVAVARRIIELARARGDLS